MELIKNHATRENRLVGDDYSAVPQYQASTYE